MCAKQKEAAATCVRASECILFFDSLLRDEHRVGGSKSLCRAVPESSVCWLPGEVGVLEQTKSTSQVPPQRTRFLRFATAQKRKREMPRTLHVFGYLCAHCRVPVREMNIFKKLFSVSSHVAINFEFTSFLLSHMGVIYDSHLLAGVFCAWDIELLGPRR
jgi:hypothetical protein